MAGKRPDAYPIRIDLKLMAKAKIIAKENGRSFNKEVEILIKKHVSEYESIHGEIVIDADK